MKKLIGIAAMVVLIITAIVSVSPASAVSDKGIIYSGILIEKGPAGVLQNGNVKVWENGKVMVSLQVIDEVYDTYDVSIRIIGPPGHTLYTYSLGDITVNSGGQATEFYDLADLDLSAYPPILDIFSFEVGIPGGPPAPRSFVTGLINPNPGPPPTPTPTPP